MVAKMSPPCHWKLYSLEDHSIFIFLRGFDWNMTNESPHGFPYSFLRGLRSAMSFRFAAQLWSRWRRLLGGFSSNGWVETVKKSFWGVKKRFQFSRCVVPFSFPEFYLGLHFTMAMSTCGDLAQVCGFHVEWQADYAAMQCFFCVYSSWKKQELEC